MTNKGAQKKIFKRDLEANVAWSERGNKLLLFYRCIAQSLPYVQARSWRGFVQTLWNAVMPTIQWERMTQVKFRMFNFSPPFSNHAKSKSKINFKNVGSWRLAADPPPSPRQPTIKLKWNQKENLIWFFECAEGPTGSPPPPPPSD